MANDVDYDDSYEEVDEDFEEEEVEGEAEGGSSRLRPIILILVILVLLCLCCFLAPRFLPVNNIPGLQNIPGISSIPGMAPAPAQQAPPTPALDTPAPLPTEEVAEPAVTEEMVEPTEELALATTEPTTEATEESLVSEPTDESLVDEHAEETVESSPTTTPVPGPTATPGAMEMTATPDTGPTVIVTVEQCDNNTPPTADADGPYDAMQGKGQAVVEFDGSGSSDSDGAVIRYEWNFGDGSDPAEGEQVTHGYTSPGSFVATLTVTDDCGATSQDTTDVSIVGPTPPATGTPGTPTPPATATTQPTGQPSPPPGTVGFCYRVERGDTLSGLARRFGVAWADLAFVNGVPMHYFVIAGQGLFVPTGAITQGPNLYQVESGDTLNSVARQCGLPLVVLAQANGLSPTDSLTPGQFLMIPLWKPY